MALTHPHLPARWLLNHPVLLGAVAHRSLCTHDGGPRNSSFIGDTSKSNLRGHGVGGTKRLQLGLFPAALDIAIPRGTRAPATTSPIAWHHFAAATFQLGRTETTIPGSELTIGIYSPARTIADAFRLRGEIGYEIGRDALREWLRRGGKPAEIMTIASQLPRAKSPILHALEMLS